MMLKLQQLSASKPDKDVTNPEDCNKVSLTICVSTLVFLSGVMIGSLHTGQCDISYLYNPGTDSGNNMDSQHVLSSGIVGYFTGVLLCSAWYRCVGLETQMFGMYTLFGFCHGMLPWLQTSDSWETVIRCVQAIATGYSECITLVYILYLWSGDTIRRPMIHMINTVYIFGLTTSPLLNGPDVVDDKEGIVAAVKPTKDIINKVILNASLQNDVPSPSEIYPLETTTHQQSNTLYVYTILGIFTVLISTMLLIAFTRTQNNSIKSLEINPMKLKKSTPARGLLECCLILVAMFIHIFLSYFCISVTLTLISKADWLLDDYPQHPKDIRQILTSVFMGAKAIGHLAAIPGSIVLGPTSHLYICDVMSGVAYIFMVMDAHWNLCLFWLSITFLGFAIATHLPSSLLWLADQSDFTGSVTSAMIIGGAAGSLAGAMATEVMIQYCSYLWIGYICMLVSVINLILFSRLSTIAEDSNFKSNENEDETKPLLTSNIKKYTV